MPYLSKKVLISSICSSLLLGFLPFYGCGAQRCGAAFENTKCLENLCCSTSGYCGDEIDHCVTWCDPKYGRCDPFRVNASLGFAVAGHQCGAKNDVRYCSRGMCCSEHGYCDVSNGHCGDGCQPYYGSCKTIANCALPSYYGSIFPQAPSHQRRFDSAKKNYWYFLCESEHILMNVTLPLQPVSCSEVDGNWPTNYYPECTENVASKTFENDDVIDVAFDGNLITCDKNPRTNPVKIRIDKARSLIRDIRITVRETGSYNFSLSIVDYIQKNNVTSHYSKLFEGVIKYGQTIVFFPNLETPLMGKARRSIHFTPLVGMRICEIEVSAYSSGNSDEIVLIAAGMSTVIFFLLAALIITIFCFRNRSSQRLITVAAKEQNKSKVRNEYSQSTRQSAPLPPGPHIDFRASHPFDYDENHYEYAEMISYTNLSDPQTNLGQTTEPLLADSFYDEAISLGTHVDKPHFPPPRVPLFSTK